MADIISKEHRSWNMAQIKGKDTKPEMVVRSLLHKMGYRFRLHRNDLPGKPDIVIPKYKTIIFVHGCYWHRHQGCKYAYMPKSRVDFWTDKFKKNVERDQLNYKKLVEMGWRVITVWECETSDMQSVATKLESVREK